jgi:hypothetical protein
MISERHKLEVKQAISTRKSREFFVVYKARLYARHVNSGLYGVCSTVTEMPHPICFLSNLPADHPNLDDDLANIPGASSVRLTYEFPCQY